MSGQIFAHASGAGAAGAGGFAGNWQGFAENFRSAGFDFGGGQGLSGEGFDLVDIFGEFFGGGRRAQTKRGRDISIDIELTFEEAIFGVERNILLSKVSVCQTCGGSGGKSGTEQIECKTCNGKGKIRDLKKSIFGSIEM